MQLSMLKGTAGASGVDGRSVELQRTATAIQWRPTGGTWADLVPLATITGPAGAGGSAGVAGADGKSVELQRTATAIQWRVAGGTWVDLVALSAITGPAGAKGDTGATGLQGLKGDPGTPADMTRVTALESSVAALQSSMSAVQQLVGKTATGVADIPSLIAGASTTVQVTLRPALADTTGMLVAAQVSGTNTTVAGMSVTATTIVSSSRVDVTVRNSTAGLISANTAKVVVDAVRP